MLKHTSSISCCLKVAVVALFCITKPRKKLEVDLHVKKVEKLYWVFFGDFQGNISKFRDHFLGQTTFRCTIATCLPRGDPKNLCESKRIRLLATQLFIVSDKGSFPLFRFSFGEGHGSTYVEGLNVITGLNVIIVLNVIKS